MKMTPAIVLLAATCVFAQDSGTAKVFREQFAQLHKRTTDVMTRAEQTVRDGTAQTADGSELRHEILALTSLVHNLDEDAQRSYLNALTASRDALKEGGTRRTENPNKDVLFVEMGSEQLAFVLGALDNFLETEDKAFLGFAKQGNDLTSSIEKLL
jgi:hypothetical protein